MSRRTALVTLAAVLACAALARLAFPAADSPATLSWSGGEYADEGFWSFDARNGAVFGTAIENDWSNRRIAPLSHALSKLAFAAGGVGLAPLRIMSGLISLAAVAALAAGVFRAAGRTAGVLAGVFFGLSYVAAMLGRIFILETPVAALLAGAFALLVAGPAAAAAAGAGVLAGVALATKATCLPFLPAAALWLALAGPAGRRGRRLAAFLAGAALPYAAYRWLVVAPAAAAVARYNAYYGSQQDWGWTSTLVQLATQPAVLYFARTPVLLLAALAGLAALAAGLLERRPIPPAALLAGLWLAGQVGLLAFFGYRPLRYYAPALPAAAALAALVVSGRLPVAAASRRGRLAGAALYGLAGLQAALIAFDQLALEGRLLRVSTLPEVPGRGALLLALLALPAAGAAAAGWRPGRRTALAAVALFLAVNAFHYGEWAGRRTSAVRDGSRALARLVPPGSVVAGQWAPAFGLENELRVVPLWPGFVNDRDPERLGITHLLAWEYRLGDELALQRRAFPGLAGRALPVHTFWIKGTPVRLLEVAE